MRAIMREKRSRITGRKFVPATDPLRPAATNVVGGCRTLLEIAAIIIHREDAIAARYPAPGPLPRSLRVECEIDQRIVIEVDRTIAVEIPVEPAAGASAVEAAVDAAVVVEVHLPVEVGVAVVRVLHEHGGRIDRLVGEGRGGTVNRFEIARFQYAQR